MAITAQNRSTTHFATDWMPADVTQAEVEAELNAWYGEGWPGIPTITISSVVEPNTVQDQPFFQYLPLAAFEVKTSVGSVWLSARPNAVH